MTSHSRHSVTRGTTVTLPHLFRPSEIAEALGCSEWWVKEQARRRRIPFTRVGGAYRFTADHVAEIVALFEERPARGHLPERIQVPTQRSRRTQQAAPAARLRAKRPRRAGKAESAHAAA